MRQPAVLDDREPEIGILADGIAGPAAGHVHRRAPDQAHGAVNDDGVFLVALDHADVEEPGIFAVHHVVHQRAVAVAMVLRRLHEADPGIGEQRHQVLQPVRLDDIVGVDDADDLGIDRGALHGDAQGAGLEAFDLLGVDELEALAERAAVILDRLPERRIGRVVDDDNAFEIRIIQPRDRIERLLEHVGRLEIGRHMDRDLWKGHALADRGRRHRRSLDDQPARVAAEGDRGDFLDPRHRDQDQRHQQDHAQRQREGRAEHEVMAGPIGEHGRGPGADAIGRRRQQQRLHHAGLGQPAGSAATSGCRRERRWWRASSSRDSRSARSRKISARARHSGCPSRGRRRPRNISRADRSPRRCCIPCRWLRRG